MIFYALIFSIVTSVLCRTEELTLPVTTCKRNSIDYSTCLKVALEESWPRFQKGLPEFDFPRLEPLFYTNGKFVFNRNGISGEVNVINATIFGLAITRFLDVRPHFLDDVFRLEIDTLMPKVFIYSYVSGEANLGEIRGYGAGQLDIIMNGNNVTWDITGHIKNDTWTIEHFQYIITIGRLKVQLIDFFDGNKELTDVFEAFVNKHWPSIYPQLAPTILEVTDSLLTDLANRLFSKVSFSKVFP
ncbi:uncharacterized protein LOC105251996 [Camponotus floridanus]|uniref:uncharacterized protein LOC105251996 n=1 Tax=Camponotus floridanus TaxID=104421 RepID=UPI00059B7D61|nr:uncharacterized protein LOC105251996 [Camponotus floridanus]